MNFSDGRKTFDLGVKIRARLLTTVPDSTSLKFILLGTLTRHSKDKGKNGERHVVINMDFETLGKRKCGDRDMEQWYARTLGGRPDCLMGHKVRFGLPSLDGVRVRLMRHSAQQWFMRRKADADCVVHEKFKDPVGREEDCPCSDEDYEWFVHHFPSSLQSESLTLDHPPAATTTLLLTAPTAFPSAPNPSPPARASTNPTRSRALLASDSSPATRATFAKVSRRTSPSPSRATRARRNPASSRTRR